MTEKITKTDAEWRKLLTPEQFAVTRKHATERAFTGEYVHNNQDGAYVCVACGQPLFSSKTKFDSGTGWPSFWDMIEQGSVVLKDDNSFFMHRVEVVVRPLRVPPRPPFRRRPAPHRPALLHQLRCPVFPPGKRPEIREIVLLKPCINRGVGARWTHSECKFYHYIIVP